MRKLLPFLFGLFVCVMTSPAALAQEARICRASTDNKEGLEACTAALAQTPGNDVAKGNLYFHRGLRHAVFKQYDEAIEDYTNAIALLTDLPSANVPGLFNEFVRPRPVQFEASSDDYMDVTPLEPGLPGAYANRGLAYRAKKQYALALADLTTALDFHQDNILARIDRAVVETDLHQYSAAAEDTNRAIQLQPGSFLALGAGCMVRAAGNNDLDMALDECDRALDNYPQYAPVLVDKGFIFLRRGDYSKAIAQENEALSANAKLAIALYVRGKAKQKSGDETNGKADMDAAIAIAPDIAERYNNLASPP